MQFFDNIKAKAEATRAGRRKAERDIDLVNQFIDVHEGKPDYAIMRKFLDSLGDDVRPGFEAEAYLRLIRKHQDFIRESGVLDPQNVPSVLPGFGFMIPLKNGVPDLSALPPGFPEGLAQAIAGALESLEETLEEAVEQRWAENPNMTPEDVDEMAASHGHNTRDDECEGLQLLRQKIAERDAKK